jgi:hypothetical protein
VHEAGRAARDRGYLQHDEFLTLCTWKSQRSRPLYERNSDSLIREATKLALAAQDEQLRVGILLILSGVSWPTASVMLHFCANGRYPILDVRALWSLNREAPSSYHFDFWRTYVDYTRALAAATDSSMRTVDRALWQYSKEKQGGL